MKRYIKSAISDLLDEDYNTKYDVAYTSANSEALLRLSKDEDTRIVEAVAMNPNTPPEILRAFVKNPRQLITGISDYGDYGIYIGEAALENPNMPIDVLQDIEYFAKYSDFLKSIAINPSTPIATLQQLLDDFGKDADISYFARENLYKRVSR